MPISDSDDSSQEIDTIDAEFTFQSVTEIDFYGIKSLLRQGLDVATSETADYILSKPEWSNTVKVDGQSDPFALMTLLPPIQSLNPCFEFILKRAPEAIKAELASLMESKAVSWLFSERLVNMPPQIAPPLYKFMLQDLATYQKEYGVVKYLLMCVKLYNETEPEEEQEQDDQEEPRKKRAKKSNEQFYFQAEDELLVNAAKWSFDFKLPNQQVSDSRGTFSEFGVDPFRRVILVDVKKMASIQSQMEEMMS